MRVFRGSLIAALACGIGAVLAMGSTGRNATLTQGYPQRKDMQVPMPVRLFRRKEKGVKVTSLKKSVPVPKAQKVNKTSLAVRVRKQVLPSSNASTKTSSSPKTGRRPGRRNGSR